MIQTELTIFLFDFQFSTNYNLKLNILKISFECNLLFLCKGKPEGKPYLGFSIKLDFLKFER